MKNVSQTDRIIRVVVGLVLLSLLFVLQGPIHWVGLLGLVALGTAAIGYCPLYSVIGVCTLKK